MIKNILSFFALMCVLASMPLFSVFIEMEVWSNGTNYRYLLEDIHRDYIDGRLSIAQQADLLWALQQKKPSEVFVIAEDSNSYSGTNKAISEFIARSPQTVQEDIAALQQAEKIDPLKARGSLEILNAMATPLSCLLRTAEKLTIPCYNAECIQSIDYFNADEKASKEEVTTEFAEHIDHIRKFNLLKPEYSSLAQAHQQLKAAMSFTPRAAFCQQAIDIRYALVNAKTIHKLLEWDTIKHGFVCEGANHIQDIKKGLRAMGYKRIDTHGTVGNSWIIDPRSEKEEAEKTRSILAQALDIRTIFTKIYAKQELHSTVASAFKAAQTALYGALIIGFMHFLSLK